MLRLFALLFFGLVSGKTLKIFHWIVFSFISQKQFSATSVFSHKYNRIVFQFQKMFLTRKQSSKDHCFWNYFFVSSILDEPIPNTGEPGERTYIMVRKWSCFTYRFVSWKLLFFIWSSNFYLLKKCLLITLANLIYSS